jgi:hypothetical protein
MGAENLRTDWLTPGANILDGTTAVLASSRITLTGQVFIAPVVIVSAQSNWASCICNGMLRMPDIAGYECMRAYDVRFGRKGQREAREGGEARRGEARRQDGRRGEARRGEATRREGRVTSDRRWSE